MVSCFERTLLPKWRLHFLLNPLLSLVESSLFSIRPFEEWAGLARPGQAGSSSSALKVCIREAVLSRGFE